MIKPSVGPRRGAGREISVYDRMCWPDGQLERSLARGAHRRELLAYFGPRDYELLTKLARQAESQLYRKTRRRAGSSSGRAPRRPSIYLLPGMLGSQLGWPRSGASPPDLLWLDPTDVVHGRLIALGEDAPNRSDRAAGARLQPLGIIPHTYLQLKLRLAARGFRVVLHDYDWRCDLDQLARALAHRLHSDPARELVLLGHSMGGLLARAVLRHCSPETTRRIVRLIGVGTPYGGAISAAQALRGTYPVMLRLAALDPAHGPEALSSLFRRFTSLYQMLPTTSSGGLDLLDRASWPRSGPGPDPRLLARSREFNAALTSLAAGDARFISIVGTGQRTVTGIARRSGQFQYEVSAAGDGTVPAVAAMLPGAAHYSLRCEHSELPRDARVAAAIADLLLHGHTRALQSGVHARAGRRAVVSDAVLRRSLGGKIDWHRLSAAARRRYLNSLNAPPRSYRAPR